MSNKKEIEGLSDYEIEAWITRLGSYPKAVVKSEDLSASYEMTAAKVLALENGQFALVTESGCSCYSSSDADIDLFPTETAAVESFDKWVKENTRDY